MVAPGNLPLTINRGTEFDGVILNLTDDGVTVTGTLSPNVTGTFTPHGTFGAYDLFILEGTPSTFLYFNVVATSYIIARTLTQGALTDFWVLAPASVNPTGSYAPAGAYSGTATVTNHPVDLTTFTPEAQVRRTAFGGLILDLNPSVTDAAGGQITIPPMSSTLTRAIESHGDFMWDLVLTTVSDRFGPYVKGKFTISDNITQATAAPPSPP